MEQPAVAASPEAEDTRAAEVVEEVTPVAEEAVDAVAEPYADKNRALRRSIFLVHRSQERLDELHAVEALQICHLLAKTDIFHRYLELVADTDDYTAFGRTIEFGNSERSDLRSRCKLACLLKCVLSC